MTRRTLTWTKNIQIKMTNRSNHLVQCRSSTLIFSPSVEYGRVPAEFSLGAICISKAAIQFVRHKRERMCVLTSKIVKSSELPIAYWNPIFHRISILWVTSPIGKCACYADLKGRVSRFDFFNKKKTFRQFVEELRNRILMASNAGSTSSCWWTIWMLSGINSWHTFECKSILVPND